jgi:predicted tellurium resistance membrane protein TerC
LRVFLTAWSSIFSLFAVAPPGDASPEAAGTAFAIGAALVTLTAMEIVLGIDNVIFLAIVAGRLPKEQQPSARKIGLIVALGTRLLLLFALSWLISLQDVTALDLSAFGLSWLAPEARLISVKDLVLLLGGAFLIAKSTIEIHHKLEGADESHAQKQASSFALTIVQIAILDVVFSLDSVITAVGMAQQIWVMVVAMVIASLVMIAFAGKVSDFVARHPTVKILALAFLILIGVMLVAEGFGQHINKGYIYFAMAFSIVVEVLNMRLRGQRKPIELHDERVPGT